MTRVPELERALFDAAEQLERGRLRSRRRWRRRALPLITLLAGFAVTGGAVAAITGLLRGDPVPPDRRVLLPQPAMPTTGFTLAAPRAADPDGGPPWGIGTYIAHRGGGALICTVVGRVQEGQLGVVGRDGVFHDDGRFHALTPASQTSGECGGQDRRGRFVLISSGPPIPASGYSGAPGTAIGGCRERVNLDGPTVSPQTRRRLRNVPECTVAGERWVISGFAGPSAVAAIFTAGGHRTRVKLDHAHNSPYLFVTRAGGHRPTLTITTRDGTSCHPLEPGPCNALFAWASTTARPRSSRHP